MILLRIIRFVIIVFLAAVAFSLVRRFFHWLQTRSTPQTARRTQPLGPNPLYRDPICGKNVAAEIAHTLKHAGHTYHFCSSDCRSRFLENPTSARTPE